MPRDEDLDRARAELAELASRLLLAATDPSAREALSDPQLIALLDAFEPGVSAEMGARAKELPAELTRLFLLGGGVAPALSAWTGDVSEVSGAALASRVPRWRERLGVRVAAGPWGRLPEDHIAPLLSLYARALREDAALAHELEATLSEPLARFTRALRASAQLAFSRALASLCEAALPG